MIRRARNIFRLDLRTESGGESDGFCCSVRVAVITPVIIPSTISLGLDLGCVDSGSRIAGAEFLTHTFIRFVMNSRGRGHLSDRTDSSVDGINFCGYIWLLRAVRLTFCDSSIIRRVHS
jgi:hypothetical protein